MERQITGRTPQKDKPQFGLGEIVVSRSASAALTHRDVFKALVRHQSGDWGDVPPEGWIANDDALKCDWWILSSYESRGGVRFWIITMWDRSSTTILLPGNN